MINLGDGQDDLQGLSDPSDPTDRQGLARTPPGRPRPVRARVETDGLLGRGADHRPQPADRRAWVDGQRRRSPSRAARARSPTRASTAPGPGQAGPGKPQTPKVALTISWKTSMKFYGQSDQPAGPARRPGRVLRRRPAPRWKTPCSLCQEMTTYMDQTVTARPVGPGDTARTTARPPSTAAAAEPEPKPQIALIDCFMRQGR